jgi:pimeloyl-ACP methyl ester carboxylesterase
MQRDGIAGRASCRGVRAGLAGGVAVAIAVMASPAMAAPPLRCAEVRFAVGLVEGGPLDQELVATLCGRGSLQHKTIQILIHGGTYDRTYWDFPFEPERYSYVRAATAAGFATLSLDRVGSGASSHPDPGALTLHTGAHTVHQVVQRLRRGDLIVPGLGRVRGERVMLVGHSLGSFIASIESATYNDVDGVILSGYSHTLGPGVAQAISTTAPALLDPKFASAGLAPGYLTTLPGTRGGNFYFVDRADPAVIAVDEQLKQTVTIGELGDIVPSLPATLGMTAPALVVVGDLDTIACLAPSCSASGSLDGEKLNYGNPSCVEIVNRPSTGHNLNLQLDAPEWFAIAAAWSRSFVGADTRRPAPRSCP